MNDVLTWIIETIQGVDPIARTAIAGLAIMLETSVLVGLVVPGDTVVIVASIGVSNLVEYIALVITIVIGSLMGESIGFALGRFFGPKIRESRVGTWIGRENWWRAENYLDRRGGIAVFISRFLPVFHSLIPLTVGMSTMSYRRFMKWTIPACIIWAVGYGSVGWAAAGSYRELSGQLAWAGYVFVGIIVAFLLAVVGIRAVLARSQRKHMLRPGDGDANTQEDVTQ